jgi:hypothetical protein
VTMFRRVNATSLPIVAPNFRRPATYVAPLRNLIPPIARASDAGKGVSPSNSVLGPIVPPPPVPPIVGPFGGSLSFDRFYDLSAEPVGQWLDITGVDSLSAGTGDFTVEWWQFLDSFDEIPSLEFPRAFWFGNSDTEDLKLAVSLESISGDSRIVYVWTSEDTYDTPTVKIDNRWAHFAIVRLSGVIKVYLNGSSIATFNDTSDVTATGADARLYIGSKPIPGSDEIFEGYITNFRWTNAAVYTTNFAVPFGDLAVLPETKLLLLTNTAPTAFDNVGSAAVTVGTSAIAPVWSTEIPNIITGSLQFIPSAEPPTSQWLTISQNSGTPLSFGTGDFTVEWWQNLAVDPANVTPWIFNLVDTTLVNPTVLGARFARVPEVANSFDVFFDNVSYSFNIDISAFENTWVHVAIVRNSGDVTIYFNGQSFNAFTDSFDVSVPQSGFLLVGTPYQPEGSDSLLNGRITNFRWTAAALYNDDVFPPPYGNLPVTNDTVLLLKAETASAAFAYEGSGDLTVTPTSNPPTWSSSAPS